MYFHHPQPDSVFGISTALLGVISTTILGILAIFGEQIRSYLFKPDLQPADNPVRTSQKIPWRKSDGLIYNEGFIFHRIPIKNAGKATAREVRVLLTYIKSVENFIPIPLNWTHWNKSSRDISVGETAYLDVLQKRDVLTDIWFAWSGETGMPVEPTLSTFNPELGNLRLEFYERDRKVGDIVLNFSSEKDELKIVN
jgi:hypothetical protein